MQEKKIVYLRKKLKQQKRKTTSKVVIPKTILLLGTSEICDNKITTIMPKKRKKSKTEMLYTVVFCNTKFK